MKLSRSLLTLAAMFFASASQAGVVSFYGFQTNMSQWRSTAFTKTITLAPDYTTTVTDPDGYYGTDGWTSLNAFSLPTFIASQSIGNSGFVLGQYQPIDNPQLPVAPVVPQMLSSLLFQTPGDNVESSPLFAFTVGNGAPASFLMGIAFGNLLPNDSGFLGRSFRVSIGASTTEQVPLIANDGIIDWVFFQVNGAATNDVINIYGTGGPNGQVNLAAVSFDAVPEPGTYALLFLGGLGLFALNRKRSAQA